MQETGFLHLVHRSAHGGYGGPPGGRRATTGAGAAVCTKLSLRNPLPTGLGRRVGLGRTGGVPASSRSLVSTAGAGRGVCQSALRIRHLRAAIRVVFERQSPCARSHARWGLYRWRRGTPVRTGAAVDGRDVQQIVQTSARRIIRLCRKRGLLDSTQADPLTDEEPVLAAITAASVRGLIATGERAGQRLRRVLRDPARGIRTGPLCFASRGFSLHAATRIAADNRQGLEQLCRYVARPALAAGRLRIIDTDQLSFALKTPWSDGTTHLLLSPFELLEKLAALIPPPRLNLIRYHGILAPSARGRAKVVAGGGNEPKAQSDSTHQPCPHRLSWCQLLARVFSIDVTECPDCGGQMKIIAALTDPASIRSYLEGVGLSARPPPIAQARPAQQSEFEYAA